MPDDKTFVYSDETTEESKKIPPEFATFSIAVFLCFILLPTLVWGAISLFSPDLKATLDFDTGEQREKAQLPDPINLATVTADLESYYNDRVPFRSVLFDAEKELSASLEQPYNEHILPFLSDLLYNDLAAQQPDVPTDTTPTPPALDDLFGDTTTTQTPDDDKPSGTTSRTTTSRRVTTTTTKRPQVQNQGDTACQHTLQSKTDKAATCTADGQMTRRCTKCGYKEISVIPAKGHDDTLYKTVVDSCYEAGTRYYRCKNCTRETTETLPAAHDGKLIKHVAASTDDWGYDLYHCNRCDIDYRTNLVDKLIDTAYFAPRLEGNGKAKAILGRNGWLFYTGDNGDDNILRYQGKDLMTAAKKQDLYTRMDKLAALGTEKGIEVVYGLFPNKSIAYSEYMPSYTISSSTRKIDDLKAYLNGKDASIKFIYPKNEILAAKPYFQTYYKLDTHWNQVGAFQAVQTLYKALDMPTTNILRLKVTDQNRSSGDLLGIGSLSAANYTDTELKVTYKPDITTSVKNTENGNIAVYTSNSPNKKNFVMIGDSFRSAMAPFIAKDFSNATFIHFNAVDTSAAKAAIKDADVLFIGNVERYDYALSNMINSCTAILQ